MFFLAVQICFVLIAAVARSPAAAIVWKQSLTTPKLKEEFIYRCGSFKVKPMTKKLYKDGAFDEDHCKKLWSEFEEAVAKKDPCSVNVKSYQSFLENADGYLRDTKMFKDKLIFWSGGPSKKAADLLGANDDDYIAMSNLFQGFIFDGDYAWCGDQTKGFLYKSSKNDKAECKVKTDNCSPVQQFWISGSINLAEKAAGKVYVMFWSHDDRGAYRKDSIFGEHELPTMLAGGKVKKLSVLLFSDFTKNPFSTCKSDSLIKMKEEVTKDKKVAYECAEDPNSLLKAICDVDKEHTFNKVECSKVKTKGRSMVL